MAATLTTKESVSHHKRPGTGGGVPDWFFWALALLVLIILTLAFMFGDRI